ncbi:methyltransferase domain-containing protein [Halomonas daqiaonensis]|uniref:Methyltransferase domain-containing protein n=1 Tax=Halomonas daqiaonensis TaxID=650850 RepID=A0A1H7HI90_9GAMM|nr:methyltransferase domain-containing protein [Halomonas daqiaonensis]SEK50093.1 Methyltransferase domain-containing protein [Halomonas daqiaonensis]
MSTNAPIIVFAYNRPDHLRQTLDHLARAEDARDSDLWIFCDGFKPGADPVPIDAARAVARNPAWHARFASVRVETSDINIGLALSIITGVSRVMEEAGKAIVVEDDLLVAPDFLRFMNDCLDFYRDDSRVGSVTGFSPLPAPPPGYAHDVMALPRNCSHGWATWADRWRAVDWDARGAAQLLNEHALRRRFNAAGNDRLDRLRRQLEGRIDSWSIRFGLWQCLAGWHTIYPVHNRVRNIGFDDSGVHTRQGQDVNACALTAARPYRLEHVAEDPAILRRVAQIYGGPWIKRTLRGVRVKFRTLKTGIAMSRWNKQDTNYSDACQHYDLEYFRDQSRDGDLRGAINAWKFQSLVRRDQDILDFGCGDGALLEALGGKNGVEVNPHARDAAQARGFRIEESIDAFDDASIDFIVSNHCLEHVEDPVSVIRKMRRVIRPDGTLVIVVPCHRADFAFRENDRDFHLFSWSAANLGNVVKLAGFEVLEAREVQHRWPPKWRTIYRCFGPGGFHAASRIWSRIDRTVSQVICVARPAVSDK